MFFENLKANILIVIFFAAMCFVGYWGVTSLQVKPEEFDAQFSDVRPSVSNNLDESPKVDKNVSTSNNLDAENSPTKLPTPSANSELKNELQKLITENVLMKSGSGGTRVGTVQKFLNIYNGTDSTVDNDFGPTTERQIKSFQKAEGLTSDGQTGPNTYKKMIEWLNK